MDERTNQAGVSNMIGIIIAVHNRPEYVQDCFDSLKRASLNGAKILIIDDASTDTEIPPLIEDMCHHYPKGQCGMLRNERNIGIRDTLLRGCGMAVKALKCDTLLVLDSDVVVTKDFLSRMLALLPIGGMVSGINCTMSDPATGKLRNPLISEHDGYSLKEAVAGQCLMFTAEQYRKYVEPSLYIPGNWDHKASILSMKDGKPIAVCVPSVCQHIGMVSAMGHNHQEPDSASDFTFLSLPDVTLFGIDSHDQAGIMRAASISQRDIKYGAVKIITDNLFPSTEHEDRRRDYSRFMLKELTDHFNTSHVLTIHSDGYVLNWKAWDPEFLKYDYIGATWAYKDNMNVGNGGFSLRSKKLCDILATNDIPEELMHPEDGCICRTFRKSLEDNFGILFAPEEVANRFSIEAYGSGGFNPPANLYTGQFGFHSVHVDFTYSNIPHFMRYRHGRNLHRR
jgi:glycosyltransferase involved in cell wall biosynthesis